MLKCHCCLNETSMFGTGIHERGFRHREGTWTAAPVPPGPTPVPSATQHATRAWAAGGPPTTHHTTNQDSLQPPRPHTSLNSASWLLACVAMSRGSTLSLFLSSLRASSMPPRSEARAWGPRASTGLHVVGRVRYATRCSSAPMMGTC